MFGLVGSGIDEISKILYGAMYFNSGEIFLHGKKTELKDTHDAIEKGIYLVPGDRKAEGMIGNLEIAQNITLAKLSRISGRSGLIDRKKELSLAEGLKEKLSIATPDVFKKAGELSGGNQQKVVIAKWLTRNCDILIFDEPTRGIDVGAKSEIYTLMNNLVKQGKSIIMISSELTEVLRMSDRILIMCEGRKTGEISIEEATQEKIMHAATLRD